MESGDEEEVAYVTVTPARGAPVPVKRSMSRLTLSLYKYSSGLSCRISESVCFLRIQIILDSHPHEGLR